MGRLGIGLVAGVINSAGARSGRPDAANPAPDGEGWAVAMAAVEALNPSHLGKVVNGFLFTAADGTTNLRRAEVIAERQDGGVTMAVLDEQGARDGTSMFSAVTALKVLGPPADPVGSSVSGADWPALAKLVKSIDPASVVAEADVFDTGTIKIKLRAILRLLAAAGVAPAADIASIPTAPDTEAAGKITGWFSTFIEKLTPLASGGAADGAISDGLDELIGEARARRAPGESLNERHVVLALQAMSRTA